VHKRKAQFLDQILSQSILKAEQEQMVLAESISLMTDSFQSEIKQDFVLCLQEVNSSIASFVESTLNHTLYCQKSLSLPESDSYNLIISNQPILYSEPFYLSKSNNQSLWAKKQSRIKPRQAVFCDFDLHFQNLKKTFRIRVFNIHLEVYCSTKVRINQLNSVWQNINKVPNPEYQKPDYFIISGDWNTFSYFPLSLVVGWAFNYGWNDYFVNEREIVKKWLIDKELIDFFESKITYPKFGASLDRIVISKNLVSAITENENIFNSSKANLGNNTEKQNLKIRSEIIQNTFGSDHYPIFVHISDPL
jgi:endonuclease/exonuclease/phosphatase family metal-dependent hydrolase